MNKNSVFQFVEVVCRIGLGALFIYSALAKISDPDDFAHAVMRYEVLPDFTIGIFSLTMPMLELLAGLSMLFTKWLRESALLVSGMLALFIVALVQALARGLEISCGCFGVPSVGGREEIVIALVRDVVLIVPSAWLMFRANGRIWPLKLMPKGWYAVSLCGFGMLFVAWLARDTWDSGAFAPSLSSEETNEVQKVESIAPLIAPDSKADTAPSRRSQMLAFSSGPIRPGEWNVDFKGVLDRAMREHRPMVLLRVNKGCEQCMRLEESISGNLFRLWQEDRAPLMAFVVAGKANVSSPETVKAADAFRYGIDKNIKAYPSVCVYWPQDGVTNQVAFVGRRGMMGGRRDKHLVIEFMSALDNALGDRLTAGRKTLESLVRESMARISAKADGTGGTVAMTPESGLLVDWGKVVLAAQPNAGYAFLDWRQPDGSLASLRPKMAVYGDMPIGCYTARFKNRSQCVPPKLVSPAAVSIRVKAREEFRHEILVDESCRPVKFQMKHPVRGVRVDSVTGVVTGTFTRSKTNIVEIAVIGNDPGQTEKTVRLTVESYKQNLLRRSSKR